MSNTLCIGALVFMIIAANQPIDRRQKADEAKSDREVAGEATVKWLVSTDSVKAEMLLESMKFGSATLELRRTTYATVKFFTGKIPYTAFVSVC